jgi:kynurenine formamidase
VTDVRSFHRSLSNWGRWGDDDQLGTLNLVTDEKRTAAAKLVRRGRRVSCARALDTEPSAHNPKPAIHHMIGTAGEGWGGDYFGLACHGYATSHIDALCHIFHEGHLYNGYPIESVTAHGAEALSIDALGDGIVSRGILLDPAAIAGRPYLDAGHAITTDDLEAAETRTGVRVEPGDVLFVRTGRWARVLEHGAWDPHDALAGLHASCLPWLHDRGVAMLGSDGVSDVVPSQVDDFRLPIHSVAIAAMGLHLIDNLDLETLSRVCTEEKRWEFMLTIAPLIIRGGTASPVNPIALF